MTDKPPPRLTRADLAADPVSLAQTLLGHALVRRLPGGARLAGTIVETEAYCGHEDKAAHSVGWRRTERTEPMFGPPGTSYVFLTYGMHHCFNVVCGAVDEPVAVLVRALAPTEGLPEMRTRRANGKRTRRTRPETPPKPIRDTDLCSGPAKLCQALVIDRAHTGLDLTTSPDLWIERAPPAETSIVNTTRIGVDYAGEWAGAPLRWYLLGDPNVSRRDPAAEASLAKDTASGPAAGKPRRTSPRTA